MLRQRLPHQETYGKTRREDLLKSIAANLRRLMDAEIYHFKMAASNLIKDLTQSSRPNQSARAPYQRSEHEEILYERDDYSAEPSYTEGVRYRNSKHRSNLRKRKG